MYALGGESDDGGEEGKAGAARSIDREAGELHAALRAPEGMGRTENDIGWEAGEGRIREVCSARAINRKSRAAQNGTQWFRGRGEGDLRKKEKDNGGNTIFPLFTVFPRLMHMTASLQAFKLQLVQYRHNITVKSCTPIISHGAGTESEPLEVPLAATLDPPESDSLQVFSTISHFPHLLSSSRSGLSGRRLWWCCGVANSVAESLSNHLAHFRKESRYVGTTVDPDSTVALNDEDVISGQPYFKPLDHQTFLHLPIQPSNLAVIILAHVYKDFTSSYESLDCLHVGIFESWYGRGLLWGIFLPCSGGLGMPPKIQCWYGKWEDTGTMGQQRGCTAYRRVGGYVTQGGLDFELVTDMLSKMMLIGTQFDRSQETLHTMDHPNY
ncbi:hypothetical protein BU15DRAFT_63420 [Melanogaster broomeanus]|nr:hypothetical protein BU15DRAFT_63420 [Melanogaster broomeanus]